MRVLIVALLVLLGTSAAHPLCLDASSPVMNTLPSPACAAYLDADTCCATEASQNATLPLVGGADSACAVAVHDTLACAACDAWAQHMHEDAALHAFRDTPWLCQDTCMDLVAVCAGQEVTLSGGWLGARVVAVSFPSGSFETWCDTHTGTTYCYPGAPYVPAVEPADSSDSNLCMARDYAAPRFKDSYVDVVEVPGTSGTVVGVGRDNAVWMMSRNASGDIDWSSRTMLISFANVSQSPFTEFGLRSVLFHPDDPTRMLTLYGCWYEVPECRSVCTTDSDCGWVSTCDPGTGVCSSTNHYDRVDEWRLTVSSSGELSDPTFVARLLDEPQEVPVHACNHLLWYQQPHETEPALIIACGDQGIKGGLPLAQNLTHIQGSILRVDVTGAALPDNPFIDTPGADPRIWAFGFRNPWRCTVDTDAVGHLYCGDVGVSLWEEVTLVGKGTNAGWERFQGFLDDNDAISLFDAAPYTPPLFVYPHSSINAILLGTVVRNPMPLWEPLFGSLLFADYTMGLMAAHPDPTGTQWSLAGPSLNCSDCALTGFVNFFSVFKLSHPVRHTDYFVASNTGILRVLPPAMCRSPTNTTTNTTQPATPGPPPALTHHARAGSPWVLVGVVALFLLAFAAPAAIVWWHKRTL